VDTGDSGTVDFMKGWADAHGIPGTRPTQQERGHFGGGDAETTATTFRLGRVAFGPVHVEGRTAYIHDPGDTGGLAGWTGEGILSMCEAVVFDVARRSLWFEPPCDRAVYAGARTGAPR
jgi:hypothetical protein